MKKILVLGGTGMLGSPAARRLQADGFEVRLLARDPEKTRAQFDDSFEVVAGDVADMDSLGQALQGCDGVLISVGGPADQLSAENVAALAPKLGLKQITYLSGSTVLEENGWFPMVKQKLMAEKAVQACGVPYTILRPTWPMEQLPRFVMGGRATIIGEALQAWHWFAADDLARMISNAYQRAEAQNKCLYVHGPEAITPKDALERYCRALHPEIESVSVMPIEAARAMGESTGNHFLVGAAALMDYFTKAGEPGDPSEANRLLDAPAITLDAWIAQRSE
jgi:uncharacterized protein YbjT (DUF2867 family)